MCEVPGGISRAGAPGCSADSYIQESQPASPPGAEPRPKTSTLKTAPPKEPPKVSGLDAELQRVLVKPPAAFEKVHTLQGHAGAVVAVALTPDASWLFTSVTRDSKGSR